ERRLPRERTHPAGLRPRAGQLPLPLGGPAAGEKMGIAVARPSSPVEFGAMADEGTVDAKVVFLLAVAGGEAHLDALAEVIDIVQDPDQMAGLLTAQEPEDVKQLLRRNPR